MRSIDEIESFVIRFASHIPPNVLSNIVPIIERVALSRSPSSAFTEAYNLAVIHAPGYELAVAKITRWIAVARRDYGDAEAHRLLNILKSLARNYIQPLHIGASRSSGQPQQTQPISTSSSSMIQGIIPGIYRYGKYDWLAQARVEKIAESLKRWGIELPSELSQLAIEIFHSMYLLNTELATERISTNPALEVLVEATEPIREDRELRRHTVLDEELSLLLTAEILRKILLNRQLTDELRRLFGSMLSGLQQGQTQTTDELRRIAEMLKEAVKNAKPDKEAVEKAKATLMIGGRLAGKFRGKLDFADRVEITKLLAEHPVMVEHILRYLKTSEEPGKKGDTIDFAGYKKIQSYTELPRIRVTELTYPEDLFLQRLATKSIDVRKYEEGTTGRKRKYVVVIDKSGSMSGEKIEWAKAVALSLLLRSDTDDVKVIFFDYAPYEVIDFSKNPVEALRKVAAVQANGGTSIDAALMKADEFKGYDIVLITDGEDTVTYKPRNRLFSVMIYGDNETLRSVSTRYERIQDLSIVRAVELASL